MKRVQLIGRWNHQSVIHLAAILSASLSKTIKAGTSYSDQRLNLNGNTGQTDRQTDRQWLNKTLNFL